VVEPATPALIEPLPVEDGDAPKLRLAVDSGVVEPAAPALIESLPVKNSDAPKLRLAFDTPRLQLA